MVLLGLTIAADMRETAKYAAALKNNTFDAYGQHIGETAQLTEKQIADRVGELRKIQARRLALVLSGIASKLSAEKQLALLKRIETAASATP